MEFSSSVDNGNDRFSMLNCITRKSNFQLNNDFFHSALKNGRKGILKLKRIKLINFFFAVSTGNSRKCGKNTCELNKKQTFIGNS